MVATLANNLVGHLKKTQLAGAFLILLIIVFSLFLIIPVLPEVPPHPDEHQFLLNAWSIMSAKQLQNFLHVASTEYALTGFFLAANILTKSGVNFPQGDPSQVTVYYARVFGLILYLAVFLLGFLLLQKGEKEVKPRSVFFAALFFGSIGIFERYFRVNSEAMAVFVTLNYLLISLRFHRSRRPLYQFFLLNLFFLFLSSFTNFKTLYMALPLAIINTVLPFFFYHRSEGNEVTRLPQFYKLAFYILGLLYGCVLLWAIFIPRPIDAKTFWYNIKNATVEGVDKIYNYPSQAGGSAFVYLYDFVMEYLGLTAALAIVIFLGLGFYFGRRKLWQKLKELARQQFDWKKIVQGDLYSSTELLFLLIFLSYFWGVAVTMIHWSRWGLPLGVFGILLISSILEEVFVYLKNQNGVKINFPVLFAFLLVLAWSLFLAMIWDLKDSSYSTTAYRGSYELTRQDIDKFLKEKAISGDEQAHRQVAWFTGYTPNVGNLTLDELVEPKNREVKYLLWPYWNIGPLYTDKHIDKEVHNQQAFVGKYAQSVSFRFPTRLARYMHEVKYFAWHYLGLTWNPEIDSLVEPQYGVVELKELPPIIRLDYEIPFGDLAHFYAPPKSIFNLRNLPDTYIFPTCYTNPDVYEVTSGKPVPPPPDIQIGARIADMYCHALWYRVFMRGVYQIRIDGLPPDLDGSQKVYSTLPFFWDPATKTMNFGFDEGRISAEFGVATKEKVVPNLRFLVSYQEEPKKPKPETPPAKEATPSATSK